MNYQKLDFRKTIDSLPPVYDVGSFEPLDLDKKIVVLDDDPTGIQTVNNVFVYTDWSYDTILEAFLSPDRLFYILTNSRGLRSEESRLQHVELAENIARAAKETGQDFILVSRSDSTLRGHYPLETETLRNVLESRLPIKFDGEIICPFFCEGGRYTIHDIHYVHERDKLVPAGLTEFAKDKTFGYRSSSLREWCEEKTAGKYTGDSIASISIDILRSGNIGEIKNILISAMNFSKIVVNATDYSDIRVFAEAYKDALNCGKRFMFRSAAAIPKVLGDIRTIPLLTKRNLVGSSSYGGLIVVGSHVNKTTKQLEQLLSLPGIKDVEFNQHRVVECNGLEQESLRVTDIVRDYIVKGITTVVYTRRERIDVADGDAEKQLDFAVRISSAITNVVANLDVKPSFIIAKGGITSSDIGTKALRVRKAMAMGQVLPGIPVWMTGEESKFPGMPYIIFPGNVGDEGSLAKIVKMLSEA